MSDTKHRVYVVLQHRWDMPGFDWAIQLSPCVESSDPSVQDSHLFRIVNTTTPDGQPKWQYVPHLIGALGSQIIARYIVVKLSSADSIQSVAKFMDKVLRRVPLEECDSSWNCRNWVLCALMALRTQGIAVSNELSMITCITGGTELEEKMLTFAEKQKTAIKYGKVIKHPKDLAVWDIRGR
ncbi:hypothetical protein AMATHDRAFT_58697 [Amanita thiersii Skay4041]|uniref:Uncharacterized protein n=1 Tax=Amanita thiersii Skay4041 TaxID=703135 RepID=A0A2A9NKU2_9AGAR|nr:hypothetical protein AMATHDRAFT_58697 [Amanita thiersii Skay4041]